MTAHPKKIENVLRLDTSARCDYFIRKVADSEMIWGLFDIGWAMATVNDQVAIPFWPEEVFAAICARDEWKNFRAKAIPLSEFLSRWLPGMDKDQRICVVFPTPEDKGGFLLPTGLVKLIERELRECG